MKFSSELAYLEIPYHSSISFITATNKINLNDSTPEILGLRTNLVNPDIYKNCSYDTQVVFTNVKDHEGGVQIIHENNPYFFKTSLDKIANAEFELVDIKTGKAPNFSIGSPTYIQILIKNNPIMPKQFNAFLDSSDEFSKHLYPQNNPSDFTIKFPERLEFSREWEVALKNIFIGNDLYNIYKKNCWIKLNIVRRSSTLTDRVSPVDQVDDVYPPKKEFIEECITLEDGRYNNIIDLCDHIQRRFTRERWLIEIESKDNRVMIKYRGERINPEQEEYKITFSPELSCILGIGVSNILRKSIYFSSAEIFLATFKPDIFLLIPVNFIVLCDIVSNSMFAGKSLNILKLLSSNFKPEDEIIKFTFYQDEFVSLNIKEFSSVRIRIVDTTGGLIRTAQAYPTRCQIRFLMNDGAGNI